MASRLHHCCFTLARKENQQLRKGQLPHLPAELWEKICKLLTTKDLARALLPSCMALHGLPLDSIHVTSCPATAKSRLAFQWMIAHMHGATEVTYRHLPHYSSEFMPQPHDSLDTIRKQGCGTLPNLRMLKLDINDTIREWAVWMKGLLKLAPNLVVLELVLVRCPPNLPIMGNLRHLDLHVADIHRGLPRCLRHLSCLKTLGIRRSLACTVELYEGFELPRSLEFLCLNHVLPHGLMAPQGCKISISGKACCLDKPQKQDGWRALRPGVTQLVAHMVDESFDWEHSVGAVLPSLEALTLIASDFQPGLSLGPPPQSRNPVLEDLYVQSLPGEQLKHLTSLTVAAASICITLPAALRLRRLCLCARWKLCLHFEGAEETASHLQAFDITCCYLLHHEPLHALQAALQKKDVRLLYTLYGNGEPQMRESQMQHIRSSPRPDADTCWYRECGCMCCSECLARSGVAVRQGNDGDDRCTAAPRALRIFRTSMEMMESGFGQAALWMPSPSTLRPVGSPGPDRSHMCIEDVTEDADEDEDWVGEEDYDLASNNSDYSDDDSGSDDGYEFGEFPLASGNLDGFDIAYMPQVGYL